jgi:hypothetical protein
MGPLSGEDGRAAEETVLNRKVPFREKPVSFSGNRLFFVFSRGVGMTSPSPLHRGPGMPTLKTQENSREKCEKDIFRKG